MPNNRKNNPDDNPDKLETDIILGYSDEYPSSSFLEFDTELMLRVFGSKGRIPVKLMVDGHVFRSSLVSMAGKHMMVFNKQMREVTGYKALDKVHIILERDTEPRIVEIPEDVREVLIANDVWDTLDQYSYSHKKEVMDWINDTKNPETRKRRIAKLAENISKQRSV
jgi:hypothetical protein